MKGDQRAQSALTEGVRWASDLTRARQAGPSLSHKDWSQAGFSTAAVHAGTMDDEATGAVGTPIYQTSTFLLGDEQYRSVEEGYARDRFIYTRYGNPNQWALQTKLAALEGAESALVFSSGMAAITATVMALLDKGAHIVASNELYGGTYNLFNQEMPTMGISVSYVDPRDYEAIEAAIRPETQMMYFEALTNPLLKLVDVRRLADIAERKQVRLVIDGTFLPPVCCRMIEQGADIVIHSASKYLNGHSDLIAGAIMGSRKLVDMVWPRLLAFGGSLDPHACFMFERGLKTLAIRMAAHERSALSLASYLEKHPLVKRVYYPLLSTHPDHDLAQRVLRNGGGMIAFEISGGDTAALELLKHLKIPKQATSLGGVESLVSLPYNTSHAGYTSKQRLDMGINPGCVRLSVGIEDPEDLIADFDQALKAL
ncbi:cystathionine beta-lyase [Oceanospirillum multiglobuliferum]|uniref:Cystathionine beta-lyase n=1 Tax=Oceanospirillum multiglobuliferum TaxID=64969 RepID=A0A1V4T541_9GAMM|nr:cystathionine beta-lyase [Oceanospirillum multiglobuliferum]